MDFEQVEISFSFTCASAVSSSVISYRMTQLLSLFLTILKYLCRVSGCLPLSEVLQILFYDDLLMQQPWGTP